MAHKPSTIPDLSDVDAQHTRAIAAGTTRSYSLKTTERGARRWRARGPEGHKWSFETYQSSTESPSWS